MALAAIVLPRIDKKRGDSGMKKNVMNNIVDMSGGNKLMIGMLLKLEIPKKKPCKEKNKIS